MPYQINIDELKRRIAQLSFGSDGDTWERQYWPIFKERFPRLEQFWQWCIVPVSERIERTLDDPLRFRRRPVSEDVWQVAYLHYSAFLHLVYGYERLRNCHEPGAFVEFYAHMGSVCDLVEDFLVHVHLLMLTCRGEQSTLLTKLSREDFLELSGSWYDRNYAQLHEHYLAKGKGRPVHLPARPSLVAEYLGPKGPSWCAYRDYSMTLRQYRNFVVHDAALGEIVSAGGIRLVPKKAKLSQYKKLDAVFAAASDIQRQKQDFIMMEEQMVSDFAELQSVLDSVWERPLTDVTKLLFEERNALIVEKYALVFTE